ncbi:MAG: hypothetical protein PWQ20_1486 [Thermotogaceae bacterium]|jgi:hypothetical protein|nr:hypothetical protein [Thermotogaceae bacterium]MDN5338416.1 hypothetical protein [Thermotogaceae bacterium]
MPLGDSVQVIEQTKRLIIVWDTGIVDESGSPVTKRNTIAVSNNSTDQVLYDLAYHLENLTDYSIYGISIADSKDLGPVA